uniref:Zinc finger BED domain-containing protein 4 n=1 Tax=Talaromyces marneffei PM1 TaxID=1077442 RepID=A0A093VMB6_TALMA
MYYLDPKNCHTNLQPQLQRRVNNVISKYCSDSASAVAEFVAFRTKSGVFFEAPCWDHTADPKLFWRMHQSVSGVSSGLANLALRFLNATANSVASEQAFSIQNLQITKIRNRLTIEHADKLNFIYINSRALNEIMSNQPNTEEIAVLEIEAENDFIDTWKISRSVMDLEYNDREEKIEESQVSDVAGPLILI